MALNSGFYNAQYGLVRKFTKTVGKFLKCSISALKNLSLIGIISTNDFIMTYLLGKVFI